jgi:putative FmdB family regulatory protein
MPTYEYRCQFCHRVSEAFQRMSDAPLVKCPYCGKEQLERIVSGGAGVIYKGEGWYVTDYSKKSSGGKDSRVKTEAKTDTAKTDTSKTETTTTETPATEKRTDTSSPPKASPESKSSKD